MKVLPCLANFQEISEFHPLQVCPQLPHICLTLRSIFWVIPMSAHIILVLHRATPALHVTCLGFHNISLYNLPLCLFASISQLCFYQSMKLSLLLMSSFYHITQRSLSSSVIHSNRSKASCWTVFDFSYVSIFWHTPNSVVWTKNWTLVVYFGYHKETGKYIGK